MFSALPLRSKVGERIAGEASAVLQTWLALAALTMSLVLQAFSAFSAS
jgi:hypothetical protein